MIHTPFKRVGEPTSFKGIKGPYLFLAMYITGACLFAVLFVFMLPLPKMFQIVGIALIGIFWFAKISGFKKKCKDGDINLLDKNRCRKPLNIKGTKLCPTKKQ